MVSHIADTESVADILTKPTDGPTFRKIPQVNIDCPYLGLAVMLL